MVKNAGSKTGAARHIATLPSSLKGLVTAHAHSGARGIEARHQYEAQVAELSAEFDGLKTQRSDWEPRIALLRSDQIDRDLLEERARVMLGRVHKNDLVIITGP